MADPVDKAGERRFSDSPQGWAARWRMELEAAAKNREKFDREGTETIKRFLDRREQRDNESVRVNVYTSNVQTQESMLYGKTPKVDVSRRFSDFMDDPARVAASMLDRLANTDIGSDSDTYAAAVEYAVSDLLRPGLGIARLRYEVEFDEVPGEEAQLDEEGNELAPEVPAGEMKRPDSERVRTEYVHWRDFRWSPARTWHDVRWEAFRSHLSREECLKIFGEKVGVRMPFSRGDKDGGTEPTPGETDAMKADPWSRAEVWEIWDKERRGVWFWCKGMERVIAPAGVDVEPNGMVRDPLELDGFWPNPRPLMANLTTDAVMPRSDYALVQDLYREIDDLSTRIDRITRACRVAGVYDKTSEAVQRLVSESTENELIAVEGWARFVEKGGVKGAIDWLPLDMIVGALDKLREMRREAKQIADEISGFSDIVRGQQAGNETATTSAIEAKFASVRMQRRQDEIARFASDLKKLEIEIVCKHFDDETIVKRSNVLRTPNRGLAQQALAVLRDEYMQYRIEVKPDSIALTDWGMKKAERTEIITTLGGYFQSTMPFLQLASSAGPQAMQAAVQFIFQTAQWLMAGIRGGSDIESVFNQFVGQVQQIAAQAAANPPQPPPPDPKLLTAQVKGQAEMTKAKLGVVQAVVDVKAHAMKTGLEMQRAQHEHAMGIQSEEAKQRTEALRAVNAATAPVPEPMPGEGA
ncbi:hypothetical protein [Anaeromyxobacter oryzisoli]|uniref:hypothetical protein n=1 Tax=Anaeromyxobacter oryzisoli TaxID=2925408 RepID=UPI001F589E40|nr:hypothetical protein [Anaeromyxobacter sp. SG63]